MHNRILYIGDFSLPKGSAAAKRVMTIADCLTKKGYEVSFVDYFFYGKKRVLSSISEYIVYGMRGDRNSLLDEFIYRNQITRIKRLIKVKSPKFIICYNYPSLALSKLIKFCKKKNIYIISDCTEWYKKENNSSIRNLIKNFDTYNRMKKVNNHLNGIICVSKYLADYYSKSNVKCVVIPTVSKSLNNTVKKIFNKELVFIFYGDCGKHFSKERLDIVIYAFSELYNSGYKFKLLVIGHTRSDLENYGLKQEAYPFLVCLQKISNDDVFNILPSCDFTIIPREKGINSIAGFPTKLSESFSVGVPVIVTKVGDMSNYVIDDVNGYIVDNCDKISFKKKLIKIFSLSSNKLSSLIKGAINSNLIKHDFSNELESFIEDIC